MNFDAHKFIIIKSESLISDRTVHNKKSPQLLKKKISAEDTISLSMRMRQ
jgi:hypothetical protein